MDLQRVGVVTPCEGLGDFPTFYTDDDAAGLLANWTASWRPALLAATKRLPEVVSAYDRPEAEDWAAGLLLVTSAAESSDAIQWIDTIRATQAPATGVIEGLDNRPEIIAAIDQLLPQLPQVQPQLEAEFFALGYAYLQTELLTRELQYSTVFNPELFQSSAIEAAQAAVDGDTAALDDALRCCYDQLEQARNHSYPVDIYLLDIVLTADSTLGDCLQEELDESQSKSVLISGQLADQLASSWPESAAALRAAVAQGRVSIVSAGYHGTDMSTLAPEAMHDELVCGQAAIKSQLGATVTVFAQHESGIAPRLPQLLSELGFVGALLVGFDGVDPQATEHGRSTWMGSDGSTVEVAIGAPRDLSRIETMLQFGEHLSETLQRDHAATLVLAGWPGARHAALEDLRCVARRSNVLGAFVTLEEYFQASFSAERRTPIEEDSLGPARQKPIETDLSTLPIEREQQRLLAGLAELVSSLGGDSPREGSADSMPIDRIAASLQATRGEPIQGSPGGGCNLVVNPWSFGQSLASNKQGEVPPLGFCFSHPLTTPPTQPPTQPRAEDLTLRNELLELKVHPESGGLQSIRTYAVRQNRMSQRLILCRPGSNRQVGQMRCESVEVVASDNTTGVIRSRGRLVGDAGQALGQFEQTLRLDARAPCVLMDVRVQPAQSLSADNDYRLQSRFALGDSTGQLYRGLQWTRLPVTRGSFTTGEYVEIDNASGTLTIAGERPLVYRRPGGSMLDAELSASLATVLARSQEDEALCFRFAIALNARYPLRTALGRMGELPQIAATPIDSAPATGWWLHTDAANVMVSRIEWNAGGEYPLRLRLIETEGRRGDVKLRCCRPLRRARRMSFLGEPGEEFAITAGVAELVVPPGGWRQVEVAW